MTMSRRSLPRSCLSLLATSIFNPRSLGRATLDDQSKSHLFMTLRSRDRGVISRRSRRRLPLMRQSLRLIGASRRRLCAAHSEWVLAYLVEGADGAAASGGASKRVAGVTPATPHSAAPPKAARKPRRRVEDAPPEVASIAPARPVALARPGASAHEDPIRVAWRRGCRLDSRAAVSGNGGIGKEPVPPLTASPLAAVPAIPIRWRTPTTPRIRLRLSRDRAPARAAGHRDGQGTGRRRRLRRARRGRGVFRLRFARRCCARYRPLRDGALCRRATTASRSKAGCWCRSALP